MTGKKILSVMLTVAIVVTAASAMTTGASAASELNGVPYPQVEFSYIPSVSVGTVRYASQNPKSEYFYTDYWGNWASAASHECLTASISMALSYIGVNATPGYILDAGNGTTMNYNSWGGSKYLSPSFDEAMNNYISGNGKYSPPIIHLNNYSSGGHYVVVLGKLTDNQYQVADPFDSNLWTININGTTATYDYYGAKTDTVTTAMQYYLENGGIPGQIPIQPTQPPAATTTLAFTIGSKSYAVDGTKKSMDIAPYIKNSRTYLPARYVSEELGAEVTWNASARTVTITKDSTEIILTINSTYVLLNGKPETLATAPELTNGRTCLPIRYVAQALGASVDWDNATRTAIITTTI